ncbi:MULTISPECIES: flavodoxin domain-containing protein [unclassified Caballeronia]|uniref:flavodoxin domain-containing protein n=1 Tax=unclassified Caballeronia TaxID=2646786 RepID=UPI0028592277|nr:MULTISPECIES: flavodoxin domain-containing protein [unclassified Caballeronia]MDR5777624.1 flavodoxin domain-containing protein [Caballeronia sp. LZ002]MDR5798535.1 flavodoxin domain-containing protein [Caballeronia sp. LZ001]MDR5853063.1 flavodoxin domain-containing protein [Caballeronia sp. LZ003]
MKRAAQWWSALSIGSACAVCCGGARPIMACGIVVSYAAMCLAARSARRHPTAASHFDTADKPTLVAYASQTGFAEECAAHSARLLGDACIELKSLDEVDAEALNRYRRAFFIVSTTGEGDAPDNASRFAGHAMQSLAPKLPSLPTLRYGILALGDRHYRDFCGFGHRVHAWLRERSAQPLFDIIEVDNGDPAALRTWNAHVSAIAGGDSNAPMPALKPFERWTLTNRTLLNPSSAGRPAYHICLTPTERATLEWQAGDIAQIRPRHAIQTVRTWLQGKRLGMTVSQY